MKLLLRLIIMSLCVLRTFSVVAGQDSTWTLNDCVRYAQANNLDIRTAELDARSSKMAYDYSRYGRLPSLSLGSNYGTNFGRSINPTTNAFENTRFSSLGLNASANVLLFGWFEKKYAIQKSQLQAKGGALSLEQAKQTLVLTVATAYLRVLLAKEQVANTLDQISLSIYNKQRIEKLLAAGKSNVLEQSQVATGLATDSSAYLQAVLNYEQAMIDLKTVLSIDLSEEMALVSPLAEDIYTLEKPDADLIYQAAAGHLPEVKIGLVQIQLAGKDLDIAKSKLYPRLSLYVSSGTNYSSSFYETLPSGETQLMSFSKQFGNNISQSVGIGFSIPVFNGLTSQMNIKTVKLGIQKAGIQNDAILQKLKQDVYKACTDYQLTLERYRLAQHTLGSSELSLKAATSRYEYGFINFYEYLTEKNNFLKAQNELSALKFELYFAKLKMAYYKGEFGNNLN